VYFVVCTLAVKKKIRAGFNMSDRTIPLSVAMTYIPSLIKIAHAFKVDREDNRMEIT
jgi:hypothetical protein